MANKEHVRILKQGVEVWNDWRRKNLEVIPDMSWADLRGVNLCKAEMSKANLSNADLRAVDLRGASLNEAHLVGAELIEARLFTAKLKGADLREAALTGADLSSSDLRASNLQEVEANDANFALSDLRDANLSKANLAGANLNNATLHRTLLTGAFLGECNLSQADLLDVDFSAAECGFTIFADIDLLEAKGLETVKHIGPSFVGINSLYRSQGKIPEVFLRGCGFPENLITYLPSLLNQAVQFYSCFISYSHADKDFARRLHDRLQGEGIRCWLDEHQLNPGDPLHPTIYEAIRVYDKIILCCSKAALKSWWVEKEFTRTIRKEEDYKLPLLIPLNLDGYLFEKDCTGWVADEIKQRSVQHMTEWKDHDQFEIAVKRVINALRTDGGKLPPPEPKLKPKR